MEGLVPVHGGVELGAGAELAGVVHGQLVALPGHAAAAGRNVLNLETIVMRDPSKLQERAISELDLDQ